MEIPNSVGAIENAFENDPESSSLHSLPCDFAESQLLSCVLVMLCAEGSSVTQGLSDFGGKIKDRGSHDAPQVHSR